MQPRGAVRHVQEGQEEVPGTWQDMSAMQLHRLSHAVYDIMHIAMEAHTRRCLSASTCPATKHQQVPVPMPPFLHLPNSIAIDTCGPLVLLPHPLPLLPQVIAFMAAALAAEAPARLPPYTPWCLGAYLATLVLAHAHQAFPATLWLWPLGRLERQLAPATKRALPPPVPSDGYLVVACRLYIAVLFWVMYGQLAPLYVTEKFALSHATVAAVAYTAGSVHGFIVSCLRWRSSLCSNGSGKEAVAAGGAAVTAAKKTS